MRQGSTTLSDPFRSSIRRESNDGSGRRTDDRDAGTRPASEVAATIDERVAAASRHLAQRLPFVPRLGIVLGSGLGGLAGRVAAETVFPYDDLPGWPRATAIGHAGNLIVGHLAGVPVAVLQGRLHAYEGHSLAEIELPIRVLSGLGVGGWVLSNAAGGLNPRFRRGELMAIDGHLDLTFGIGRTSEACGGRRPFAADADAARRAGAARLDAPYFTPWLDALRHCARREDVVLHQGTYAVVSGPTYETRAEYRAFRRMGADAVGMSTIPEVRCAAAAGLPVLAISVITNEAKPDAPIRNDAEEVLSTARGAEAGLERLIEAWLAEVMTSK